MSSFSCRLATVADAPTLVDFNIGLASETDGKMLEPAIISAGVAQLFEKPQYGFYIVAEQDGTIAGSLMITYEWSDWRNGVVWWIQSVYVNPAFRKQGVYTTLYQFTHSLALEKGDVRGLRLYVKQNNATAQTAYERLGMTKVKNDFFQEMF